MLRFPLNEHWKSTSRGQWCPALSQVDCDAAFETKDCATWLSTWRDFLVFNRCTAAHVFSSSRCLLCMESVVILMTQREGDKVFYNLTGSAVCTSFFDQSHASTLMTRPTSDCSWSNPTQTFRHAASEGVWILWDKYTQHVRTGSSDRDVSLQIHDQGSGNEVPAVLLQQAIQLRVPIAKERCEKIHRWVQEDIRQHENMWKHPCFKPDP